MTTTELLSSIKARLQQVHGRRLRGVILYGSEARHEARTDSDVDVIVLLDDPVDYGRDLDASIKALYAMSLEIGRTISPTPASAKDYETIDCPLYRNVRREGIAA